MAGAPGLTDGWGAVSSEQVTIEPGLQSEDLEARGYSFFGGWGGHRSWLGGGAGCPREGLWWTGAFTHPGLSREGRGCEPWWEDEEGREASGATSPGPRAGQLSLACRPDCHSLRPSP